MVHLKGLLSQEELKLRVKEENQDINMAFWELEGKLGEMRCNRDVLLAVWRLEDKDVDVGASSLDGLAIKHELNLAVFKNQKNKIKSGRLLSWFPNLLRRWSMNVRRLIAS